MFAIILTTKYSSLHPGWFISLKQHLYTEEQCICILCLQNSAYCMKSIHSCYPLEYREVKFWCSAPSTWIDCNIGDIYVFWLVTILTLKNLTGQLNKHISIFDSQCLYSHHGPWLNRYSRLQSCLSCLWREEGLQVTTHGPVQTCLGILTRTKKQIGLGDYYRQSLLGQSCYEYSTNNKPIITGCTKMKKLARVNAFHVLLIHRYYIKPQFCYYYQSRNEFNNI